VAAAVEAAGSATVDQIVTAVYTYVPEDRHPIARWSVWAHLRKLADEGRVRGEDLEGTWESLAG
jgi:hypothetical protein